MPQFRGLSGLIDQTLITGLNYAPAWGTIVGTLSDQLDLQSALDGKVDDAQVLTDVPAGALFTDTTYTTFTDLAAGLAPASGGGTENFLRADGTWAVPPGTAGGGQGFATITTTDYPILAIVVEGGALVDVAGDVTADFPIGQSVAWIDDGVQVGAGTVEAPGPIFQDPNTQIPLDNTFDPGSPSTDLRLYANTTSGSVTIDPYRNELIVGALSYDNAAGLTRDDTGNVVLGINSAREADDRIVVVGNDTMTQNVGHSFVGIGHEAGHNWADGDYNIFIGFRAAGSVNSPSATGTGNIAIGDSTLSAFSLTRGDMRDNVCIGADSMARFESGEDNVAIGARAGGATAAAGGEGNIFIGRSAGPEQVLLTPWVTGTVASGTDDNIIIGSNAGHHVDGNTRGAILIGSGNTFNGTEGVGPTTESDVSNRLMIHNGTTDTPLLDGTMGTTPATSSLTVNGDLTVTGTTTIGAEPQVTNHTRAGNTQIWNGVLGKTLQDIDSLVTASTWESFGPTGSGATNIWSDMDDLPTSATILIVNITTQVTPSSTAAATVDVYHRLGGAGDSPSANYNRLLREVYDSDGVGQMGSTTTCMIPLNGSRVFELQWVASNASAQNIQMFYKGFMTD